MDIAQSDRESLAFKPEATFGVVSTTGNSYGLRMNGEQLKYNLVTTKSDEIIDDRTVRDVIVVDADSGGSVPAEFSYGEYDWLVQAMLATTISNVVGTNGAATGTATISATGLTYTAGAGATPLGACESGQWVRVSGATNTGNNKLVQLTAAPTATGFTAAGAGFIAETGTVNVVVQGARFKNGAVKRSFSVERKNADLNAGTGLYECFRGQVGDKWTMTYQPGQKVGQTYEFKGKDALPMSTGSALPGTRTASLTNNIMNAVSNLGTIMEGGALLTSTYVRSFTQSVMNNVEMLKAVGNLGPVDFRLGEFNTQLQLELFLADATHYNKFINNTGSSFSYRLTDVAGNAYVVTLPSADYTTGERPNPGRNNSIILTLGVEALRDPVTGFALIIDRCGAAVTPWA
jgi:hypothetical protein